MLAVAAGSGLAGFLTSFSLLHLQVQAMWLRYGLSVLVAYGVFLVLVRAWTQYYRARPAQIVFLQGVPREDSGPKFGLGDLLDLGDVLDFVDCGGIVTVLLLLLLAVLAGYWAFSAAVLVPEWIAAIVLDCVLSAALYHCVRKTAAPFACVFVFFVLAGAACHAYAPEAASIGGVVRHAIAMSHP
jgi:hypothetical protein